MKRILVTLTTLYYLLSTGGVASADDRQGVQASTKPNILFFVTDDTYRFQYNCLPEGRNPDGSPKNLTPALDTFFAASTTLNQQYVTSPVCTPSRFSCITGLYPSRTTDDWFTSKTKELHGQTLVEWNTYVTHDMPTLPKLLRNAGYRTGIVGKNHMIRAEGMEKPQWLADPYDPETLAILDRNRKRENAALKQAGFDYQAAMYYNNPDYIGVKALASHNLDWTCKGALDFLDIKSEKPFFLYVATTIPHGPEEPERSWDADPRITAYGMLKEPLHVMPERKTIPARLKKAGIPFDIRGNQANILWLDDMFAAIIQKLKDTGQYDNTIILYFNDHGQKAKGTIYQGGVHTEAFIAKGGKPFPVGKSTDTKVTNIDFTPTLLDLAGVDISKQKFDGKSILPMLNGKTKKIHDALYFELGFTRGIIKDGYKYIAVRYPDVIANMPLTERITRLKKFNASQKRRGLPIYTTDPMSPFSHVQAIPGGGDAEHESMQSYPAFYQPDQLYDLKNDPNEQFNLANSPTHSAKLKELQKALSQHLKHMPGTFGHLSQ